MNLLHFHIWHHMLNLYFVTVGSEPLDSHHDVLSPGQAAAAQHSQHSAQ